MSALALPLFACAASGMGRVEAFAVEGLEAWFNSRNHPPPHVHVRRPDEWEIRVHILETTGRSLSYSRKWGRVPDGRDIRVLRGLVATHRTRLMDEWDRKVRS